MPYERNNMERIWTRSGEAFHIRKETPEDYKVVEKLTRNAFWNVYRPGATEHYILYAFRKRSEFLPDLSLILEREGDIIGHVMYARAILAADDGRTIPVMTFGPVSIAPSMQGKGYGRMLIEESMRRAETMGGGAVFIEGNPAFYGKLGFLPASSGGFRCDGEEEPSPYFLYRPLRSGFLSGVTGVYHSPSGYLVDEADVAHFDRQFPYKEKKKLPSQLFE